MLYNSTMDLFSALADPTRRSIVEMLAERGQLTASEIAREFSMSAPAVSQHLKILRDAGVLHMEKRSQQRLYRLNPEAMTELDVWVQKMTRHLEARYKLLDQLLEQEKNKQREEQER